MIRNTTLQPYRSGLRLFTKKEPLHALFIIAALVPLIIFIYNAALWNPADYVDFLLGSVIVAHVAGPPLSAAFMAMFISFALWGFKKRSLYEEIFLSPIGPYEVTELFSISYKRYVTCIVVIYPLIFLGFMHIFADLGETLLPLLGLSFMLSFNIYFSARYGMLCSFWAWTKPSDSARCIWFEALVKAAIPWVWACTVAIGLSTIWCVALFFFAVADWTDDYAVSMFTIYLGLFSATAMCFQWVGFILLNRRLVRRIKKGCLPL